VRVEHSGRPAIRFWHTDPLREPGRVRPACGKVWFSLSGSIPAARPLSDPGRVMLRFGWPLVWDAVGGVKHIWRFNYRFSAAKDTLTGIVFVDPGTYSRFTALDSLRDPAGPLCLLRIWAPGVSPEHLAGRFRDGGGRIRLVLSTTLTCRSTPCAIRCRGCATRGSPGPERDLLRQGTQWVLGKAELVLDQETRLWGVDLPPAGRADDSPRAGSRHC